MENVQQGTILQNTNKSNKMRLRGFSLIELLVVIGIILVLAAIISPIVATARIAAYHARTITEFKQLAVANSLYTQDYGAMALRVPTLVSSGLIGTNLASDPLDI